MLYNIWIPRIGLILLWILGMYLSELQGSEWSPKSSLELSKLTNDDLKEYTIKTERKLHILSIKKKDIGVNDKTIQLNNQYILNLKEYSRRVHSVK